MFILSHYNAVHKYNYPIQNQTGWYNKITLLFIRVSICKQNQTNPNLITGTSDTATTTESPDGSMSKSHYNVNGNGLIWKLILDILQKTTGNNG